jgi:tetratricopeptide (TPR) repeat protein
LGASAALFGSSNPPFSATNPDSPRNLRGLFRLTGPLDRTPAARPGDFFARALRIAGQTAGDTVGAMRPRDDDWEDRLAALWLSLDDHTTAEFFAELETLLAQLPPNSALAAFERASAQDSTGHPDLAVALYREALALGLAGIRRRRAVIQLASSLRNLGHPDESVALLRREADQPSDELDDAVRAFLALALHDVGAHDEALALALTALAPHLPRYQRSLANYAGIIGRSAG